jgi:heme A synthase
MNLSLSMKILFVSVGLGFLAALSFIGYVLAQDQTQPDENDNKKIIGSVVGGIVGVVVLGLAYGGWLQYNSSAPSSPSSKQLFDENTIEYMRKYSRHV